MTAKRRYELKERARKLEWTRRRITEATVQLHCEVGPAATQIAEIARRAGVQRRTVYNHFPDGASLLTACSAHWRELHPAPDAAPWLAIDDGGQRARRALVELYAWYRETEPMTANVLRDAQVMPALREIIDGGLGAYLAGVRRIIAEPFAVGGRGRKRVEAAAAAATDFHFWLALAPMGDADAADLAAGLIELAAHRDA